MRGLSTELKVGLFTIIVVAILAFMTFRVGGLDWLRRDGNTYYATFRNIAGLEEKTKVKIAGVDAGTIEKIELVGGRAKLTVSLDSDIAIYSDSTALIKASGLLGDKYLEIRTGSQPPVLRNGEKIPEVLEVVDIDDMVRKLSQVSDTISSLTSTLNETLGSEEAKRSLRETFQNLGSITARIDEAVAVNDTKLRTTLDNINELTTSLHALVKENREPLTATMGNIRDFSAQLKTEGPVLVANLNEAASELKELVQENRPAIKSTVSSLNDITSKIERGEGTLGKLVKDERLYESVTKAASGIEKTVGAVDRFRTFLTFQGEYLTRPSESKGYFYLTLQPKPEKYYILGVVSDPLARVKKKETVTTTSSGTTTTKEEKTQKKIEFTAQYARRYKDIAVRVGMTENSFGFGGDYFFHNDKGKVSADIWDFSSDEEDAKKPHMKVGVDYFLFKNLFISAGADNILNDRWRGAYAGAGMRFEDEDIKYLFGTLPRISP